MPEAAALSLGRRTGTAPKCLIVRPRFNPDPRAGDEIVFKRSREALERHGYAIALCELQPVGTVGKLWNLARGTLPEISGYESRGNVARVRQALRAEQPEVAAFFHEVTFPCLRAARDARVPTVLAAHNVHSVVARTEPSLLGQLFRRRAEAFERRWYAAPDAALVCISENDVLGLRASGVTRTDIHVAPPGMPPDRPLRDDAMVLGEAVLTGSYGWWRKRRDLRIFAAGPPLGVPLLCSDDMGCELLGGQAVKIDAEAVDWGAGLRFGLITDRFAGGFKLKSLEYVANNCIILSFCDLWPEFRELPHAREFVRCLSSRAEAARVIAEVRAGASPETVARFRRFKQACLDRFSWANCLEPLLAAVDGKARRTPVTEARVPVA